jgi:Ribbon-helix-helix protein, copG family
VYADAGILLGMSRPSKAKGQHRKPFTTRGLIREVSYLHPDEAEALARRAEVKRCSKSEVIRRALRKYLGIED